MGSGASAARPRASVQGHSWGFEDETNGWAGGLLLRLIRREGLKNVIVSSPLSEAGLQGGKGVGARLLPESYTVPLDTAVVLHSHPDGVMHLLMGPCEVVEDPVVAFYPQGPEDHRSQLQPYPFDVIELPGDVPREDPLLLGERLPWPVRILAVNKGVHDMHGPLPGVLR